MNIKISLIDLLILAGIVIVLVLGQGWVGVPDIDSRVYMAIARNMLTQDDWLTPFYRGVYFISHPPLVHWVIAFFFKLFGVSLYVARFPNVLAFFGTAVIVYLFGVLIKDRRVGLLAALAYCLTPQVIEHSGKVRLDLPLSFFIALGVLAIFLAQRYSLKYYWLLGIGVGCGILTKGIAGLGPLPVLGLMVLIQNRWRDLLSIHFWGGLTLSFLIPLAWIIPLSVVAPEWLKSHYQLQLVGVGAHADFEGISRGVFYFPSIVLFRGLPWAGLAIFELILRFKRREKDREWTIFPIWIFVIVGAFSIPRYKVPPFMLPAYPAVAILAGFCLDRWTRKISVPAMQKIAISVLFLIAFAKAISPTPVRRERTAEINPLIPVMEVLYKKEGVKEIALLKDRPPHSVPFLELVATFELYLPVPIQTPFVFSREEFVTYFQGGKNRFGILEDRDLKWVKEQIPSLKIVREGKGAYLVTNRVEPLNPIPYLPLEMRPYSPDIQKTLSNDIS